LRIDGAGDASAALWTVATDPDSVMNRVGRDDDRRRFAESNRGSRQIFREALQKNLTGFGRDDGRFSPTIDVTAVTPAALVKPS
jgi:hypothetical protein